MNLDDTPVTLMEGYTVRSCTREEFREVFATWGERLVHEDAPVFRFRETYSDVERELLEPLAAAMESLWPLYLLVEKDGALAAWHTGSQDASDTYYMRSSAVVHEHRRKGIYSALLAYVLALVRARGFQVVKSRHRVTNNAVIIPKLAAGFHVSGLQVHDIFGLLVELSMHFNPVRAQVFRYYTQGSRLDETVRRFVDV